MYRFVFLSIYIPGIYILPCEEQGFFGYSAKPGASLPFVLREQTTNKYEQKPGSFASGKDLSVPPQQQYNK